MSALRRFFNWLFGKKQPPEPIRFTADQLDYAYRAAVDYFLKNDPTSTAEHQVVPANTAEQVLLNWSSKRGPVDRH